MKGIFLFYVILFVCVILSVFQLDFEIFRTIASFIKIPSGHSLIIKLIFIKFFRTIWEIGGQMSWDPLPSWITNVLRPLPSWITVLWWRILFSMSKYVRLKIDVQFSNVWPFFTSSNRCPMTSLTYTLNDVTPVRECFGSNDGEGTRKQTNSQNYIINS